MSETDTYSFDREFEGGVLGNKVHSGKRKARIRCSPEGLNVLVEDGDQELTLPWRKLAIEQGGASGNVVFCRAAGTTIYSEAPDFLRALEGAGGNDVADALARLAGQTVSSRSRHLLLWTVALGLLGTLLWVVPRVFRGSVDSVVSALPYSVDEKIGQTVLEAMDPGGPEVDDPVVLDAVQTILDRLTPHAELEGATFVFRVIDNEQANAYALPGGFVTVFTGLLLEAETPEQVAGVLAHEIAHVTERHGLRRIAHSIGLFVGVQLVLGDTQGLLNIALELFTLGSVNDYSQDQETEADLVGVRMLHEARIDPTGLSDFFQWMRDEYGDVPESLSWISTHPMHEERIQAISAQVDGFEEVVEYEPIEVDWVAVRGALE